jgi:hypothetical protein
MSEPAFVAATLAWCNERRAERGKKPLKKLPKGRRMDAKSCPCGAATDLTVYSIGFGPPGSLPSLGELRPLPKSVSAFVSAFDNGELPQYEAQ